MENRNSYTMVGKQQEFFSHFRGRLTFQTFDDKGKDKSMTRVIHYDRGNPHGMLESLFKMNKIGIGIYFCVNETNGNGRKAADVIKIRACYADLDGAPLSKSLEYKPSLVVESSPGRYHCYWLTDDTPIEAFTAMQKNIIRHLGSDPAVHDLSRVLRVPWFYHNKGTPFLARLCGGSGERFTYRDLVSFFPPQQVKKWSSPRYHADKCPQSQTGFKGKLGCAGNGERNNYVMRRIGGMMKRGLDWQTVVDEATREGLACTPPLDVSEINSILNSAKRYRR